MITDGAFKDDNFVGLLDEPVGSGFARDEVTGAFFPVNF
jgi:hypothetical protein